MPQRDESQEVKEARRNMREGRTPLLEAIKETYRPYLLLRKGLERKNAEIREQVGLLSSEFNATCKQLRESSRKAGESPAAMVEIYKELERQATGVAAMIKQELPALEKLYGPVAKAFAAFEGAQDAYNKYMDGWRGKLPGSDFSGRALELILTEIERSLR